jgi:hypothetical protein
VEPAVTPDSPTAAKKGKGPKAKGSVVEPSTPEVEQPTIVVDEEEEQPQENVAASVAVGVLVDCGLLDPAWAAQMYGSDADLSAVTVTREEYLRDLCPQDPDVQAFCADAFEQLGSTSPKPVDVVVESDESAALNGREDAIRREISALRERIVDLQAQKERATAHRALQEQAATLMQMKLTAVRMELKEISQRLPRKLLSRASEESTGSSGRFKSRVAREPLLPLSASMPMIEDVAAVSNKAPDQPRKRAPGLKRDPPSRGGDGMKNIFEEYKTKDNRKSDAALLKDQYLRDDAVETFKSATRRKGHDFQRWINEQSGDYLSALGTYYNNYAHEVWKKKQQGEQGGSVHAENTKSLQELSRLADSQRQRLASGRTVLGIVEETPRKSVAAR